MEGRAWLDAHVTVYQPPRGYLRNGFGKHPLRDKRKSLIPTSMATTTHDEWGVGVPTHMLSHEVGIDTPNCLPGFALGFPCGSLRFPFGLLLASLGLKPLQRPPLLPPFGSSLAPGTPAEPQRPRGAAVWRGLARRERPVVNSETHPTR